VRRHSTNTFNSTAVSQADYGMQDLVGELNLEAARLARQVADEVSAATGVQRFRGRCLWVPPTDRVAVAGTSTIRGFATSASMSWWPRTPMSRRHSWQAAST